MANDQANTRCRHSIRQFVGHRALWPRKLHGFACGKFKQSRSHLVGLDNRKLALERKLLIKQPY